MSPILANRYGSVGTRVITCWYLSKNISGLLKNSISDEITVNLKITNYT